MAMLGNTDPIGICLVFPSIQITSSATLVFYLALRAPSLSPPPPTSTCLSRPCTPSR